MERENQINYFSRPGGVAMWWNPEQGIYSRHYKRELLVLDKNIDVKQSWNILDLGTGKGRFARYFASRGCMATAVDINMEMLDIAKERALNQGVADKINFVCAPVDEYLKGENKRFDLICAMEFLDHYPDLEELFGHIHRLLAPGGRLVISYVSSISLYGLLFQLVMKHVKSDELRVARTYSPHYIEKLLNDKGFDVESYGVGIATIILREKLNRLIQFLLSLIISIEARIKPFFSNRSLSLRCVHVVNIAIKK